VSELSSYEFRIWKRDNVNAIKKRSLSKAIAIKASPVQRIHLFTESHRH